MQVLRFRFDDVTAKPEVTGTARCMHDGQMAMSMRQAFASLAICCDQRYIRLGDA